MSDHSGRDAAEADKPRFPQPGRIRGILYFNDFAVEQFARALVNAPAPPEPEPTAPVRLVGAHEVARRFNWSMRTLRRRCAEAMQQAAATEK